MYFAIIFMLTVCWVGLIIPREMKNHYITKTACNPVAVPEVVTPQHAYKAGEDEAHEKREPRICSRDCVKVLGGALPSRYYHLFNKSRLILRCAL